MSTHLPPTGTNINPEIQTNTPVTGGTSTHADATIEQVSQHLNSIFDGNDALESLNDTSKHHITDQLIWLKSQIRDPEKQQQFTHQCDLIQLQITDTKFEKIPSELVILLITREWKRITRLFDQEATASLSNLAETVILQLEKSWQSTQKPPESKNWINKQSYTSNWLAYSISYQGNDGILKLGAVEKLNKLHTDILKLLRDNSYIQQIKFHSETPVQIKRYLMDILSENRPLLGVLRIVPEWRVGTYMIRGVKRVNDILSQQTADELFFSIKEHLEAALNERYGMGKTLRITASHNKLTLVLPKETTFPLPAQEEIDALVQKAIAAKQEVLLESMERFQKSKFEVAEAIKEIQVTCGESQVASPGWDLAKLEAVYESEIRARGGIAGKESIQRMKDIHELETQFAFEFLDTRFRYGKYQYPAVILDTQGEMRPHPLLIEIIRKPGGIDLIEPERLGQKIKKYLDVLNRELDYIAPALDFKLGFLEARQIDVDFRNGSISRKAIETTYKNSLSKTAFFWEIEGKTGACILIDIKGMFIKNCNALMELSDEIAEKETKVSILERLDVLGNITRSFIRGTDEINGYYPNIICTHGGDEFMFFIEHATADSLPGILKHARDSLGNEGFDVRTSARLGLGSKEIFNALDGETKIAKIVETIGRLPNGGTPSFLRHIEVSAESFSPDYIVNELHRRRKFVEFALSNIATDTETCSFIELRGLKIKIEKTWVDSIRIQALSIESNPI